MTNKRPVFWLLKANMAARKDGLTPHPHPTESRKIQQAFSSEGCTHFSISAAGCLKDITKTLQGWGPTRVPTNAQGFYFLPCFGGGETKKEIFIPPCLRTHHSSPHRSGWHMSLPTELLKWDPFFLIIHHKWWLAWLSQVPSLTDYGRKVTFQMLVSRGSPCSNTRGKPLA